MATTVITLLSVWMSLSELSDGQMWGLSESRRFQQFSLLWGGVSRQQSASEGEEFIQVHCCSDSSQIGIKSKHYTESFLCHEKSVSLCMFTSTSLAVVLLPLGHMSSHICFAAFNYALKKKRKKRHVRVQKIFPRAILFVWSGIINRMKLQSCFVDTFTGW